MLDKTVKDISSHQAEQAAKIRNAMTDAFTQDEIQEWLARADSIEELVTQLYMQFLVHLRHAKDIIQDMLSYYALTRPDELASISWTIDIKNQPGSPSERLYREMVVPTVISQEKHRSDDRKVVLEPRGDYRRLRETYGAGRDGFDLELLLTHNLEFKESGKELGLQLVDVAANAFSRGLNGAPRSGWIGFGNLMLRRQEQIWFVEVVRDGHNVPGVDTKKHQFNEVLRDLNFHAKDMRFVR
jgi:hypothetical protein